VFDEYDGGVFRHWFVVASGWIVCVLGAPLAAQQPPVLQPPRITERVDVARVVVDVHVLAANGAPVTGLNADNFRAFVDGRPVTIERVRWTTEAVADRERTSGAGAGGSRDEARFGLPSGRQIVLFVQRDLEPTRFQGLVAMLRRAHGFLEALGPDDRVAVVSFQSHLDLWSDYTTDRKVLSDLVDRQLLTGSPPSALPPVDGLSLARYFDRDAGRRAAAIEAALVVLGRALDKLPGEKTVVLFGFGFGRWSTGAGGSHISIEPEYGEAKRLLTRARATVFCLDITDADDHTLAAGLKLVAADTGGFFVRTNTWPGLAMNHLVGALAGRYELAFVRPDLPRGEHAIRIELVGRQGTVLARGSYRD